MIKPVASTRLLINGAETTAGSMFSLTSISGNIEATDAAQTAMTNTAHPTVIAISVVLLPTSRALPNMSSGHDRAQHDSSA